MALSVRAAGIPCKKVRVSRIKQGGMASHHAVKRCRPTVRPTHSPMSSKRLAQWGEHGHLDPPATPRLAVSMALAASTPESDICVASEGSIGRSAGGTERRRDERGVKGGPVVICAVATAIDSRER